VAVAIVGFRFAIAASRFSSLHSRILIFHFPVSILARRAVLGLRDLHAALKGPAVG
jgi:hypothetical protein